MYDRTRDCVVKNNARLNHDNEGLELRDQGFTRPKVLFILPTRNSCVQVVETLISLSSTEQQVTSSRLSLSNELIYLRKTKNDFKTLTHFLQIKSA